MIKPEPTKDGIKLRNTKTGKLVGSVAFAGKNAPTPQNASETRKVAKLAQKIENMTPVKRAKYEAKLAVKEAKNEAKKITNSLRQRHYSTHAVPAEDDQGYEDARQIIATAKEEGKAKVMQARREEHASALMGLPPNNTFSDDARKKRELNNK
jgi:hypothetical protein